MFNYQSRSLLLQHTGGAEEELLKRAIDVSPYNAIAYGLLVGLLLFATWLFYRNWRDAEKYNRDREIKQIEHDRQMIEFMIEVKSKLGDNRTIHEKTSEMVILLNTVNAAQVRTNEALIELRSSISKSRFTLHQNEE